MAIYKGYTTSSIMGAIADGVLLGSTDDNLILTPNANGTWHIGLSGTIYNSLSPYNNTINLGSSSNRFQNIYGVNINASGSTTLAGTTIGGTLTMGSNNIIFGSQSSYINGSNYTGLSARATSDSDGNVISTTYSKERYTYLQLAVADWTAATFQGESCFKCEKALSGATTANSHAFVSSYITSQATKDEESSAFNLIYDSYCEDDKIIFYATEKPSVAFKVQVKGW